MRNPPLIWAAMLVRERPSGIAEFGTTTPLGVQSACAVEIGPPSHVHARCAGLPTNVGHLRVGSLHGSHSSDQASRAVHPLTPRMPGFRARFELVQWIDENSRARELRCYASLARWRESVLVNKSVAFRHSNASHELSKGDEGHARGASREHLRNTHD